MRDAGEQGGCRRQEGEGYRGAGWAGVEAALLPLPKLSLDFCLALPADLPVSSSGSDLATQTKGSMFWGAAVTGDDAVQV